MPYAFIDAKGEMRLSVEKLLQFMPDQQGDDGD
jgi:hypothetical protein